MKIFLIMIGLLAGLNALEFKNDSKTVALWHFNEGTGTAILDASGNGHDGNIFGAQWVSRGSGNALRFNGTSDYVLVPFDPGLNLPEFSIEILVRPEYTSSGYYASILSRESTGCHLNVGLKSIIKGGRLINSGPLIFVLLVSQKAEISEAERATFDMRISSISPLKYQWLLTNSLLPMAIGVLPEKACVKSSFKKLESTNSLSTHLIVFVSG